jgi:hypothetical protein
MGEGSKRIRESNRGETAAQRKTHNAKRKTEFGPLPRPFDVQQILQPFDEPLPQSPFDALLLVAPFDVLLLVAACHDSKSEINM